MGAGRKVTRAHGGHKNNTIPILRRDEVTKALDRTSTCAWGGNGWGGGRYSRGHWRRRALYHRATWSQSHNRIARAKDQRVNADGTTARWYIGLASPEHEIKWGHEYNIQAHRAHGCRAPQPRGQHRHEGTTAQDPKRTGTQHYEHNTKKTLIPTITMHTGLQSRRRDALDVPYPHITRIIQRARAQGHHGTRALDHGVPPTRNTSHNAEQLSARITLHAAHRKTHTALGTGHQAQDTMRTGEGTSDKSRHTVGGTQRLAHVTRHNAQESSRTAREARHNEQATRAAGHNKRHKGQGTRHNANGTRNFAHCKRQPEHITRNGAWQTERDRMH